MRKARIFFVTSFQGGIGKTTTAAELALEIRKKFNKPVAVLEFNMFRPSLLAAEIGRDLGLKYSYLDYYKSNWAVMTPKSMQRHFFSNDGIYYIPFCGNKGGETLRPTFQISEHDLSDSFNHFVEMMDSQDGYIVLDCIFRLSAFAVFMLSRADVILYMYRSDSYSKSFSQQFKIEAEKNGHAEDKIIWLESLDGPQTEQQNKAAKNSEGAYLIPHFNKGEAAGRFSEAVAALTSDIVERKALGTKSELGFRERESLTEQLVEYRKRKQQEVISDIENSFGLSEAKLRERVEEKIEAVLTKDPPPESAGPGAFAEVKKYLLDEILGLGPLENFMRDDDVDEIMVNGPDKIFVEKHGKIQLSVRQFADDQHVRTVIERILRPVGRTVNEKMPYVDARLPDGSRVHAIIPPLSLNGPMITIRKFSRIPYTMDDLVYRFKSATKSVAEFLKLCVHMKRNIIVSGGAGSGKTTLLNVLSGFIFPTERIITIEDSAELRLNKLNLGRLEARQQGTEAKNQVTIRDLVRNALRMRPDRIIIGECRGGEAIDMLQAMNTGHDGSLTTLHANTTRDAIARLETMVLLGGLDLPLRAIREQIASSVNIIIQNSRLADGSRTIMEIAEITGLEDNVVQTESVFKYEKRWIGEDGKIIGELVPTGYIPQFIRDMSPEIQAKYAPLFECKPNEDNESDVASEISDGPSDNSSKELPADAAGRTVKKNMHQKPKRRNNGGSSR